MPIAYEEADCGILPKINPKRGLRFLGRRFKVGSWSLAALLAISSQSAVFGQAPSNGCGPGSQYPGSAQYQGPGQYQAPGQYHSPGPYQSPGQYQMPGQYHAPGQYGAGQQYSQGGYGQASQYYGQGPDSNQGYIQAPDQSIGQGRAVGANPAQIQAENQKAANAKSRVPKQAQPSPENGVNQGAAPNQTQWSGPAVDAGIGGEGYVGPLPSGGNWQGSSSWSAYPGFVDSQVVMGGPHYGYGGGYNGASYFGGPAYGANCGQPVVCAPEPEPLGFYGGFDFLFIRPHFDNNVAFVIDPPSGNTLQTYDYDYEFSPRVYLGWQDECSGFGARFGFWQLDADAGPYSATSTAVGEPIFVSVWGASDNLFRAATAEFGPGAGGVGTSAQTLTAQHELDIQVYDFEITQSFRARGWNLLAGAGIRYANIEQLMNARATRDSDGRTEAEVSNDLEVDGVGPTASLQLLRPIGNSRFSAFAGLRGSLLMAKTEQTIHNGYWNETTPTIYDEFTDHADQREVITALEMQLGMQYQLPLSKRCDLLLRSAYETQAWFDVGGPVDSHSTLSFDGISVSAGLLF